MLPSNNNALEHSEEIQTQDIIPKESFFQRRITNPVKKHCPSIVLGTERFARLSIIYSKGYIAGVIAPIAITRDMFYGALRDQSGFVNRLSRFVFSPPSLSSSENSSILNASNHRLFFHSVVDTSLFQILPIPPMARLMNASEQPATIANLLTPSVNVIDLSWNLLGLQNDTFQLL